MIPINWLAIDVTHVRPAWSDGGALLVMMNAGGIIPGRRYRLAPHRVLQ